ncbi:MAG: SPFH domain-containing protein [Stackebrandtia sp.]
MATGPAVLLMLVVVVVVVVGLVFALKAVHVVPQNQVHLLERLGRYRRTLRPGLNVAVPFVDRVGPRVDMREQRMRVGPKPIPTSAGLPVAIVAEVDYAVDDAARAVYEVADYHSAVEQVVLSVLRNLIGSTDSDEVQARWHTLNQQLRGALDTSTAQWGLKIARAEVLSITRGDPHAG